MKWNFWIRTVFNLFLKHSFSILRNMNWMSFFSLFWFWFFERVSFHFYYVFYRNLNSKNDWKGFFVDGNYLNCFLGIFSPRNWNFALKTRWAESFSKKKTINGIISIFFPLSPICSAALRIWRTWRDSCWKTERIYARRTRNYGRRCTPRLLVAISPWSSCWSRPPRRNRRTPLIRRPSPLQTMRRTWKTCSWRSILTATCHSISRRIPRHWRL